MMGDVGILWVDHNHLLMAGMPLAEGINDGLFVIGPYDDDSYWPIGQRSHAHWRGLEYHQVAWGRVLLDKVENRFYLYLDKVESPLIAFQASRWGL
jgi:hypothetical protein